tara:strand:- start:78 stop:320 length:243 start_codon:yes stop_codon:yes gene_type:complete
MTRYVRALEARYQAKVEEALATIDLYLTKSVGIGEHPDILEVLDTYVTMLDENQSKLDTLRTLFTNNEEEQQDNTKTSTK